MEMTFSCPFIVLQNPTHFHVKVVHQNWTRFETEVKSNTEMTYLKVMKISKSDTTVITSLFKQNAHESSIHNQQQKYDINQKMENGKKKKKNYKEKKGHTFGIFLL